jgi:hypothetical protein
MHEFELTSLLVTLKSEAKMKKLVALKDVAGKTVAAVAASVLEPAVAISFTDDTFVVVGARLEAYDGGVELYEFSAPFSTRDFAGDEQLINAGIMTREELATHHELAEQERARLVQQREFQEYQRLHAKYGE